MSISVSAFGLGSINVADAPFGSQAAIVLADLAVVNQNDGSDELQVMNEVRNATRDFAARTFRCDSAVTALATPTGARLIAGARGAAVANAIDAATTMARLNDLLARLRVTGGHGLIAD